MKEDLEVASPSNSQEVKQLLTGTKLALCFTVGAFLPVACLWVLKLPKGMCMSAFLAALDQTIVGTALPTIATELHGYDSYSWVATAYVLTSTAFQPLYGRFSDLLGRKVVLLFGLFVFEIGSLLCAVSTNINMLIAARAIAGIGGAGLMSLVLIITADIINERDRGKYQGIVSAIAGLSSIVGPVLGGVFTDHVSWRWCFYINLPLGGLGFIAIALFLHLPTPTGNTIEKLKRVDFFGVLSLIPAVVALLLAVTWGGYTTIQQQQTTSRATPLLTINIGGAEYAWNSGVVISMFILFGFFTAVFIVIEAKVAEIPLMPTHLFKLRNYSLMNTLAFCIGFIVMGLMIYLPLYFQLAHGDSAVASGLRLLPTMIGIIIFSIVCGVITSKTGRVRYLPAVGAAILSLGIGILMLLKEDNTFGQLVGFLIPAGVGIGLIMQSMLLIMQSSVDTQFLGVATSALYFFRGIGGVIGVAVLGAILTNTLTDKVKSDPNFASMAGDMGNSVDLSVLKELPPVLRASLLDAFMDAIHHIFLATMIVGLVGALACLCVKRVTLKTTIDAPNTVTEA